MRHVESIAADPNSVLAALKTFTDAEVAMIAYAVGVTIEPGLQGPELNRAVVDATLRQGRISVLAGELMRRKPELLR
jgi:hypothetical protein